METKTVIEMTEGQKKATAEAMKMVLAAKEKRQLHALMIVEGIAFATDSFGAVKLEWFNGLPDGAYCADALLNILKSSGRFDVQVTTNGHGLQVDYGSGRYVGSVPVLDTQTLSPGFIRDIFDDAVSTVTAEGFIPEVAALDPKRVLQLAKCMPGFYEMRQHVLRQYLRNTKTCVLFDGDTYALIMPMRYS
jgi:hypothetical protein